MYKYIVLILACLLSGLYGLEVITITGESLAGDNLKIEKGTVYLDSRELPLGEVATAVWKNKSVPGVKESFSFSLVTGEKISGVITGAEGDILSIASLALGSIKLDLRFLASVRIRETEKKFEKASDPKKDIIYFVNGDMLQGFLNTMTDTGVVFESVIGRMHYNFAELSGIKLQSVKNTASMVFPHFMLETASGDLLKSASLDKSEKGYMLSSFSLGSVSIVKTMVKSLDVTGGRMQFLSELKPEQVQEKPYWENGFVWKYRVDRSLDGHTLTIGGKEYSRGFGVHSFCELTFRLDAEYETFFTDIGIDDEVSTYGNADFRVIGDGKVLFERKGVSVDDTPVQVKVDVSSVNVLKLVVDFGKNFGIGDHADWADARLIRKK